MGLDKAGSKSGGFFNLFDWNRKSRKKLFSSGNSPVESKQKPNPARHAQTTRAPKFIEDDDSGAVFSIKGSDYSCASSITDEDGHATRAPGVVARLMGLDTMPTTISETISSPLFDSRSTKEKSECSYRKTPSSPIERFKTEVLPPRTARSLAINQYKLLSPIKNPKYFSGKDAAHIMEAASKILVPGPVKNTKPSLSSLSVKTQAAKENIGLSRRAFQNLRGQSLNESWDSQDAASSVGNSSENKKIGSRTVSLAVQAKVNVKKREGSTATSLPRETEETGKSQPFKSQRSYKGKPQRNSPPAVLRQNNQKQNNKPAGSTPQLRKSASSKNKSSAKIKEDSQSQADTFSSRVRKKRSIDWSSQSGKNSNSADSSLVGRREKRIQSGISIDEHKRWDDDSDVVSFTFTSPMGKPTLEKSKCESNLLSGDALSMLLEQKLRELTSGFDQPNKPSSSSVSVDSGPPPCSIINKGPTEHASPLSVLDPTFSNGSFTSCDVSDITSNEQKNNVFNTEEEFRHVDGDSASSSVVVAITEAAVPDRRREAEYVAAILRSTNVEAFDVPTPSVFERLEQDEGGAKVGRLRRKVLFDCVGELLDERRRRQFCGSFRAWARGGGGAVERVAEEAHRQILRWEDMGGWMVDELVENDLTGWVDFDPEAFQAGVDLESQIVSSLLDELLSDFPFP
ncbi:uncharacterized protein LOC144709416 [Wolffia australiana]